MLKKSLAWVLALALLISTMSGLALITSANENAKFAFASYVSGEDLYVNATKNLYTAGVVSTPMAEITGNAGDRYAVFMANQNDQLGINIPASLGLGSNIVVEVKFFGHTANADDTRLGMNYKTASGQTDYGKLVMHGARNLEYAATELDVETSIEYDDGNWGIYKIEIPDADYGNGGQLNFVKWSQGNNNDSGDGWYIESILVYDAANGRPDEEDLYIRENTVGYIDFTGDEAEKSLLTYTTDDKASIVEFDGMNALAITGGDGYHLTVKADDVDQPAVNADDANVTVMFEGYVASTAKDWNTRFCMQTEDVFMYGRSHGGNAAGGFEGYPWNEWYVFRYDLTGNDKTEFKIGSWFNGAGDILYIRKVVVCRTEMVAENTSDYAFLDLDNPYSQYNDFSRVTATTYDLSWHCAEGEGEAIKDDDGKTAVYYNGGFLFVDVADAFTKNKGANIPDLAITVTYLDGADGALEMHYNQIVPEGEEDGIPYRFAGAKIADLTNDGDWHTETIYLSDAQFRNGANGSDFRIGMKEGLAISAIEVRVGANKADLQKWIDKVINTSKYTDESLKNYNNVKAAVTLVNDDLYATKAQVDAAVKSISDAFDALEAKDGDPRFTVDGAVFAIPDASNGEITTYDGWYVWKFTPNSSGKFIGIGDENGILSDSKSVTYEYEILMDTSNGNDRCFLGHGNTDGWQGVKEGAPPAGTGFAAGGQWGAVPSTGRWGIITLTDDTFDPTVLNNGNITELGSWMDNGTLYVRAIRAYDAEDPTKCISVQFKEDVAELIVNGGDADVALTEKEGKEAYVIPSGWKALNIDVQSLLDQGIISADSEYVAVEFQYWLEDTDNNNELLMIKHYNPDGTGQNDNKADVCEHQKNHGELNKRNDWTVAKFVLDDPNFGDTKKTFNITYGNGTAIYICGVKVYECDEEGNSISDKPAQWGEFTVEAAKSDHPYWDFDEENGYGMSVSFSEGTTATAYKTYDGKYAAQITDDMMYVKVDDEMIGSDQQYIRIDLTIVNGSTVYARYNKILDEGIDDSAEPYLTQYRFHASGENEVISEDGTANQWITAEGDFVNMLGVIKPCNGEYNWEVQSIYLTDAQFRNAANGSDFRLHFVDGGAYITRIDVYAITADEVPAVAEPGKLQELADYADALEEKYGDDIPDELYDAIFDLEENYLPYAYRATNEEIQAKTDELKALEEKYPVAAGIPGDVDGDGKVSTTDARLTLQVAAKKITGENLNMAVGDVDGKEGISTPDARMILQAAAKKITL